MDCGYKVCRSKRGFIVDGACYVITFFNHSQSQQTKFPAFRDAQDVCSRNGGSLPAFSSYQHWQHITELFKKHLLSPNVHVGLTTSHSNPLYSFIPIWENGLVAYPISFQRRFNRPVCGFYSGYVNFIALIPCLLHIQYMYTMCEYQLDPIPTKEDLVQHIPLVLSESSFSVDTVQCPGGHHTHSFLSCDVQAHCFSQQDWSYASPKESWDIPSVVTCPVPQTTSLPPSWLCVKVTQRVPYSLVCDHRQYCQDNSDEDFCVFPACPLNMSPCGNSKQCYYLKDECDGIHDCQNRADESQCSDIQLDPSLHYALPVLQPPPPFMVTMDGKGMHQVHSLPGQSCPHTHFWCLSDSYCLPVYVRCNGIYDCPQREDEHGCNANDLCPGLYRCRGSSVCLHPSHACDGVVQCPQRDDELWCNATCPQQCQCWGLALVCRQGVLLSSFPDLRYVDVSGSGMNLKDFSPHFMLIHLSLEHCKLSELDDNFFGNLNSLDVSNNYLQEFQLTKFDQFPQLKALFLSGNPLTVMFERTTSNTTILSLQYLDMSFVELPVLYTDDLRQFVHLKVFNLSGCQVKTVSENGFDAFKDLQMLDIRGCKLSQFPRKMLANLFHLYSVFTDNFKLCCEAVLPQGFSLKHCHAPFDEVSSCEALLHSTIYRVFLSLSAVMALVGNFITFLFRLVRRSKEQSGFHAFVTNLCIADFLMGVYLSIIGVADHMYLGSYLWEDTHWRHSIFCMLAGFLSFLSSELSVFMICLITIDRFLVLRFPFSQLRFHYKPAMLVSVGMWLVSLLLASAPLFPHSPYQGFYSQVGICIPLPITRKEFQGDDFAFGVMIVLNFVLFLLIAAGQGLIYLSIRANIMAASDTGPRQSRDMYIARRLITVAVSDFLCWFPIGLVGLLAKQGVPISGEVNVAMAILVLPVNSVINPFLYTLNIVMEQRQKAIEDRLLKWLRSNEK